MDEDRLGGCDGGWLQPPSLSPCATQAGTVSIPGCDPLGLTTSELFKSQVLAHATGPAAVSLLLRLFRTPSR